MGVAVFSGMLGVTFFGLLLTPVFLFAGPSSETARDAAQRAARSRYGSARAAGVTPGAPINPLEEISMTKIALITGANKGIGFETARQLAKSGGVHVIWPPATARRASRPPSHCKAKASTSRR